MKRRFIFCAPLFAALLACAAVRAGSLEWPQFAGPHRNFTSDAKGLANSWPASGPKKLWSRDLGEGYSGISVDGAVLYTMYRRGSDEVTLAAGAATGKTIWEYTENASFRSGMAMENGAGPHATPLVTANAVYAVGILAHLVCLDKKTGHVVWSHDLWREFDGTRMDRGYSVSPIAWKDTIIMKVGGAGHALMAFNQKDGKVVWQKQDFANSPSSPILIQVDGQDQLVAVMGDEIVGINPDSGDLLWKHPHTTSWGLNIALPLWGEDNTLFVSSAYNGGCAALELHVVNGKTPVIEEGRFYAHFGSAGTACLDTATGKVLWQDRSFPKATFLYADGKLIAVDEDGNLSLATVSPTGLKVLSRAELLRSNAWTAPALVGTVLYVRDRHNLMALDLR